MHKFVYSFANKSFINLELRLFFCATFLPRLLQGATRGVQLQSVGLQMLLPGEAQAARITPERSVVDPDSKILAGSGSKRR